jgi:hypothetical protein
MIKIKVGGIISPNQLIITRFIKLPLVPSLLSLMNILIDKIKYAGAKIIIYKFSNRL